MFVMRPDNSHGSTSDSIVSMSKVMCEKKMNTSQILDYEIIGELVSPAGTPSVLLTDEGMYNHMLCSFWLRVSK